MLMWLNLISAVALFVGVLWLLVRIYPIAKDLSTHKRVCAMWGRPAQDAYFLALEGIIRQRALQRSRLDFSRWELNWPNALAHYEVGDYVRAALSVSIPPDTGKEKDG